MSAAANFGADTGTSRTLARTEGACMVIGDNAAAGEDDLRAEPIYAVGWGPWLI